MNIGKPKRTIVVNPKVIPIPEPIRLPDGPAIKEPAPSREPIREPVKVPDREKVPA